MPSSPPTQRVRAVLFDLGNTLVNVRDFNHVEEAARLAGIEVDGEALAHAFHEVEAENDREGGDLRFGEFWGAVLIRAKAGPVPEREVEAFNRTITAMDPVPELFTDVTPCLEELRVRGYGMGVVTNWRDESSARGVLEKVGLLRYFSTVVAAGSEGVAKPDPEIFRRAIARLGALPAEAVYVGDLPTTDVGGAISAGLSAVWLRRDGTGFGDDPPEITSLLELPGWIELRAGGSGRSR